MSVLGSHLLLGTHQPASSSAVELPKLQFPLIIIDTPVHTHQSGKLQFPLIIDTPVHTHQTPTTPISSYNLVVLSAQSAHLKSQVLGTQSKFGRIILKCFPHASPLGSFK